MIHDVVTPGQSAAVTDGKFQTGEIKKLARWIVNKRSIFFIGEGVDIFQATAAFQDGHQGLKSHFTFTADQEIDLRSLWRVGYIMLHEGGMVSP